MIDWLLLQTLVVASQEGLNMIVNIYLTTEERIKLNALSRKYELSISTLAENVLLYFYKYTRNTQIGEEYFYKNEKGKKTSIKPKINPTNNGLYKNYTKAYTNVLKIYLKKEINKYTEESEKFYNDLNTNLQKIKEPNWDYNRFIRSMKRYENKRKKI